MIPATNDLEVVRGWGEKGGKKMYEFVREAIANKQPQTK